MVGQKKKKGKSLFENLKKKNKTFIIAGMRVVKTVLSACGNIKQAFPDENEDILLLRSLIDVNLPKFLSFDIPLFEGIISDLFPGTAQMTTDYTQMKRSFNEVCTQFNLQPQESFFTKIVQTYEMMIVRHGFMMVTQNQFIWVSSTNRYNSKLLYRWVNLIRGNHQPYEYFRIFCPN